jgi:hypothetical protein
MRVTNLLPNLPPHIVRHAVDTLVSALALPVTDTPETRAARDEAAIAALVGLEPADAAELMLAVQIIAVEAQGLDCGRLADRSDGRLADRLRRLATAMKRHGESARRLLLQHRATRGKAKMVKSGKAPARQRKSAPTSPGRQAPPREMTQPRTGAHGSVGTAVIVDLASVRPRGMW